MFIIRNIRRNVKRFSEENNDFPKNKFSKENSEESRKKERIPSGIRSSLKSMAKEIEFSD